MMRVTELRAWLDTLGPDEPWVGIDEGGLTIFAADDCGRESGASYEIGGRFEIADLDEWDAPACLRWLADNVPGPHHYAFRADHWPDEVSRYAAHEQIEMDEWETTATEELRAAVRAVWGADTPDELARAVGGAAFASISHYTRKDSTR